MNAIQSPASPIFKAANQPAPTPPPANNPEPTPTPPQDHFENTPPPEKEASNVVKALRAIPSALAGAVICGVGVGAASLYDIPRMTVRAEEALIKTPFVGRNLKVMTAVLMPFAAVAGLVLSPVAGALYGLCTGFMHGAEDGVGKAVKEATHDVKRYHTDVAGAAVNWLKEHETGTLPEGETPIDIPIGGAVKGLVGGAINGTIGAAAATGLAAVYVLPAAVRAEAELWKSDIPLPFKVVGTPFAPAAVALAAALAPAAGALYGLGVGAKDSYQKTILESVENTGHTIKEANHGLFQAIFK